MRVKSHGKFGAVAAVVLAVFLAFAACPVIAVDYQSGEAWTYQVSTSVDAGVFVIDILGNVTYEFEEERTLTVGTLAYDVNVMSVDGELSGTMEMFGEPLLDASVTINGFLYEAANGGGIIREDMHWLIGTTVGSGSAAWSLQYETQTIVTYTPPYLAELDPESVELGIQWSETVNINDTVTLWENGTVVDTSSDRLGSVFSIAVEPATDSIITPAGTFDAIRITATDENGDREVRWWSDDVNGYVKIQSYSEGEDTARETMVLTSYEKGDSGSMLWVALVGIAVALAAIVVLAVVLLRMRHTKGS
jgi:hypothetical protein